MANLEKKEANVIKGIPTKELFAPGHSACLGCGEAIAIRHILKAAGANTIVVEATGCPEVYSSVFPLTSWNIPWIHAAFETAASVASGVREGLNQQNKKDVNVIAIGGDGGTYDIGFQALSGAFERGHKMLYVCLNNEAYENCLALDSLIMTQDGLKNITDIKVGNKIYAFNQETCKLVLKKCSGVFNNGIKKVYEIVTDSHNIKATGNHPFLVLKRFSKRKSPELIWKEVEELQKGDQVVVLKQSLEGHSYHIPNINISKKGDYKVNKIREVKLPRKSSIDLMKLLGIYVGDGWLRLNKADVGFSVPEGDKARIPTINLIKKVFGIEPTTITKNEVHVYSVNIVRFIESLGFGQGAKNKIIPPWIFTLPIEEKEAFLDGLMLSDGYKAGNSWRYLSASHELIRTLRLLLQTMNRRVGKIHKTKVKKGKNVVYRKLLKDCTYSYIAFSIKKGRKANYPTQYKSDNFLFGNKHFEMKKIRFIKECGIEPTLDLRVEDEHNFVANGIVVHNTGIQRSGATPKYAWTTTSPVGNKIKGKTQYRKPMPFIAAAHNIPYVATTSAHNPLDIITKVRKALSCPGPSYIEILCPCIPGWQIDSDLTYDSALLAFKTNIWPIYEIINGELKLVKNQSPLPLSEYYKIQGRYAHLLKPENKPLLDEMQKHFNDNYRNLVRIEKMSHELH